jgi:hypothetical protein
MDLLGLLALGYFASKKEEPTRINKNHTALTYVRLNKYPEEIITLFLERGSEE